MEPRQATQFRLGCTPAQWEGQDLALSVNSPPCLLLKTFFQVLPWLFNVGPGCCHPSCVNAPNVFGGSCVYKPPGCILQPKNTLCDLACTHPLEDSKHFTNTKLSRQVQCPEPFRADFLAAALVNFLLLAFAWGSRAETAQRYESNLGPSSSSEQLNSTRENKAGDCKANLDWILQGSCKLQAGRLHPPRALQLPKAAHAVLRARPRLWLLFTRA